MNIRCITERTAKAIAWAAGIVLALGLGALAVFYGWTWMDTRTEGLSFHESWTPREREQIADIHRHFSRAIRTGGEEMRAYARRAFGPFTVDNEGNSQILVSEDYPWHERLAGRYALWRAYGPILRLIEETAQTGDAGLRSENGTTLLHLAAMLKRYELFAPLLAHGAEADARTLPEQDNDATAGDTPLCWATSFFRPDLSPLPTVEATVQAVGVLLDAGADVNGQSGIKQLPLMGFAVYLAREQQNEGGEKLIHFLLDRGTKAYVRQGGREYGLLNDAVRFRMVSVVERLLREGYDPNAVVNGLRPLQQVDTTQGADTRDAEIVRMLLERKANPDLYGYCDEDAETGEKWSDDSRAAEGSVRLRRYNRPPLARLCAHGFVVDRDSLPEVLEEKRKLAALLLENGANPDLRPIAEESAGKVTMGASPLMECVQSLSSFPEDAAWSLSMIRLLLAHGADANFVYLVENEKAQLRDTARRMPGPTRDALLELLPALWPKVKEDCR